MRSIRIGDTIIEVPEFIAGIKDKKGYWLILVLFWALSGIYIVGPDENGVIRRFGEMVRVTSPGLNYHAPWPFETVDRPKVTQVKRVEIGFRTDPRNPNQYISVPSEALMLTGDENIIECDLIVQYQIKDAGDYLFNVKGVHSSVKKAAEAVLRAVIGSHTIDEALTTGKFVIQQEILDDLQKLMDLYENGVNVIQIQLQDVDPPQQVIAAFKDVASAKEDKNRKINEAQGYYNSVIPNAKGDARKMVLEAEAFEKARVSQANGDASRFISMLREYRKAKDVTKKRLYLETMEEILPGMSKVIIKTDKNSSVLNVLPLENLLKTQGGGK